MGSWRSDRADRSRWRRRKALARNTDLDARAIAEKSMAIAGEICIYTNAQHRPRRTVSVPIYLPETTQTSTDSLTPRQIVAELDKYVVGQAAAKRAVAIALRNRMRRQKLPPELAEEIAPKNILMIGPTGVGKTEIARRLARLAQSPFLKVEASKFTEVGYVGRDVESMVRDLVELGVDMVRAERLEEVRGKAAQNAEERLLDLLLPPTRSDRARRGSRRGPRPAEPDARALPRAAARRPPRRARRRDRRPREVVSLVRDHRRVRRSRKSTST